MSTTPRSRSLWRGRIVALIGVFVVAFSLRSAVASLSPVLGAIGEDFSVAPAIVGLIGTAPPVCFAVFGIVTPLMERKLGLERLAMIAMIAATLGLTARAFSVDAVTLLLSTTLIFAAVGVGNILLPPIVKKYFPDRIGLMTSLYSTMLAISTLIPPLIAVPLAEDTSWRLSVGVWAVFAAVAMIPWLVLWMRSRTAPVEEIETANPRVFGRLWRLPLAWALVVAFAVSGTIAYSSFAWLPQILTDVAGVSAATAGVLLSLFAGMGLPASLLVPLLVVRANATRALFAVAVVAGLAGVAGLLVAPTAAPALWVALLGIAPLLFPLTLVLLGLRTRTHQGSVALSGFVQSIGYAIVAVFPFGIGLIHDATAQWTVPLLVLGAVIAAAIPAAFVAARPHTIEDEWERRHGAW
ncbi:CynX/NimT family MFS transporter [Microbacterium koreense]|uniref:CynX/NimT family MFS transporter n=1 Tax=Microbacterium koreense TaxID=323761 RepID=A0ABW2ZNW4_9MICO